MPNGPKSTKSLQMTKAKVLAGLHSFYKLQGESTPCLVSIITCILCGPISCLPIHQQVSQALSATNSLSSSFTYKDSHNAMRPVQESRKMLIPRQSLT